MIHPHELRVESSSRSCQVSAEPPGLQKRRQKNDEKQLHSQLALSKNLGRYQQVSRSSSTSIIDHNKGQCHCWIRASAQRYPLRRTPPSTGPLFSPPLLTMDPASSKLSTGQKAGAGYKGTLEFALRQYRIPPDTLREKHEAVLGMVTIFLGESLMVCICLLLAAPQCARWWCATRGALCMPTGFVQALRRCYLSRATTTHK